MKAYFLLIFLFFIGFAAAKAQDAEVQPDSLLPQHVHIFKDPRLDILDTRPPLMAKLEAEEKAKVIPVYKPIVSADGKKKVTGSIFTTKGYRIIIYNGPDRKQAMDVKNRFARMFPDKRSYMSYNVPSYKIKVGDFEDKKEANEFLRIISKAYPTSFIVPDIVTIKNINVSE
ncbi:MAG TPA: SPOR domain-containing protein [Chitinophagaceae bacterium]|nr:SPOR domain-containing protein [Chitinophagaceae bacterium]HNF71643.1 SPOR domain-containing protein [Chitinophagaceae bacterium]